MDAQNAARAMLASAPGAALGLKPTRVVLVEARAAQRTADKVDENYKSSSIV